MKKGVITKEPKACKFCRSKDIYKNGFRGRTKVPIQKYSCHSCKRSFNIKVKRKPTQPRVKRLPSFINPMPVNDRAFSWENYNEAQTTEKLLFLDILQDLCQFIPEAERGVMGRPRVSEQEMLFCMVCKLYEDLSSRRVSSDLTIAAQRGYLDKVPHFNTILKYFNEPALTPYLLRLIELSALPLKDFEQTFAVDASGLSSAFYSRWFDYRFGHLDGKESKIQDWIKIHIICGVKSGIVTAVKVTDGHAADSPHLPELVQKTAQNFKVREVCADKGYLSRSNIDAVDDIGGVAYIPLKSNSCKKPKGSAAYKRMYYLFRLHQEFFMERYHQRSNVESVFSALKRKFSGKLRMKNEAAQVNEALAKLLCYNICVLISEAYQSGVSTEFKQLAHLVPDLHIESELIALDG